MPHLAITPSSDAEPAFPRWRFGLNHLRGEADDLHELTLPQLTGDSAEDARAARIQFVVNEDHRVAVEADVTAVVAAHRLASPHDHALDNVSGFDVAARHRLLDAGDDDVAQAGVTAPRAAQHLNTHRLLGAGVVRHVKPCIHLNHCRILPPAQ